MTDTTLFRLTIWWCSVTQLPFLLATPPPRQGICVRDMSKIKLHTGADDIQLNPRMCVEKKVEYLEMAKLSTAFADKSLLIQKIFEAEQKVILITSPSRTGKSVNLSMLKAFFELRVKQPSNNLVRPAKTSVYKFFTKGILTADTEGWDVDTETDEPLQSGIRVYQNLYCVEDLEYLKNSTVEEEAKKWDNRIPLPQEEPEGKKELIIGTFKIHPMISEHKNFVEMNLARYPVIYIDLLPKDWLSGPSIYEILKKQVLRVFNQHGALKKLIKGIIDSNRTRVKQKVMARRNLRQFLFYQKELNSHESKNFNSTDLENSLLFLSKLLHEHYREPVIILMDEYITSLEYFFLKERPPNPSKEMEEKRQILNDIQILRNFMKKTLVDNPHMIKAVITGISSINEKDLFADVPNYLHYNALENDLQQFYGFTETEVELLSRHFDVTKELADKARQFYKGYNFKRNTDFVTYNIWSIAHFLNTKKVADYWPQYALGVDSVNRWIDLRKLRDVLRLLIRTNGTSIRFVQADYDNRDLIISYQPNEPDDVVKKATDCILSLFCEVGLLTNGDGRRGVDQGEDLYVRIPNEEIRLHMVRWEKLVSHIIKRAETARLKNKRRT